MVGALSGSLETAAFYERMGEALLARLPDNVFAVAYADIYRMNAQQELAMYQARMDAIQNFPENLELC